MSSAVIIRAHLPAGLEGVRRRSVADAGVGVPAHLTLLYPFVEPAGLDRSIRERIATIARRHAPFDYALAGRATWPDTVYVAVDPEEPFVRLQADLAAAFPAHPIYGRGSGFVFVPHVTIAEGAALGRPEVGASVAWRALPLRARATALEVIAVDVDGRWRTRWRIGLGPDAPG